MKAANFASVTVTIVGVGGVFVEDELDSPGLVLVGGVFVGDELDSPGLVLVAIVAQALQVSAQDLE